jgi:hypothetical protein
MDSISTQNLHLLPSISDLKKLLKSLAVLDAISSPEWDSRYYSYNANWSSDEEMGSMRNGCGDEFYVLFNSHGCFIKGFAHESAMSSWGTNEQKPWNGLLENVPSEFKSAVNEPAFSMDNISFCIWRAFTDNKWHIGAFDFADDDDPDGSEYLLELFDRKPSSYLAFAGDYFELELDLQLVESIYEHRPLNSEIVYRLNPDADLEQLKIDLIEIGYASEIEK